MKKLISSALFLLLLSLCSFRQQLPAQTVVTTQSAANAIAVASSITTLTNSATETTLFSKTVPGGLMGTSRGMHLAFLAQLSSTLVNPSLTIKIKYGTAVITAVSAVSVNASLTSVPFYIECDIMNANATGSQQVISRVFQNTVSAPLSLGAGVYLASSTWTTDSTVDQTLAVTATFNSALTGTTLVPILLTFKIE